MIPGIDFHLNLFTTDVDAVIFDPRRPNPDWSLYLMDKNLGVVDVVAWMRKGLRKVRVVFSRA
jgi:hypothetical protein